jgi:ribosomal protein L34E
MNSEYRAIWNDQQAREAPSTRGLLNFRRDFKRLKKPQTCEICGKPINGPGVRLYMNYESGDKPANVFFCRLCYGGGYAADAVRADAEAEQERREAQMEQAYLCGDWADPFS